MAGAFFSGSRTLPKLTVEEALSEGARGLDFLSPREAREEAEALLGEAAGVRRCELHLRSLTTLDLSVSERFFFWIGLRKTRIPFGYITGKAYFRDEMLRVGRGCLIPRPETEILVEAVIRKTRFQRDAKFRFLDLGTGSGAIGIALLRHFENSSAVLSDISSDALRIAEENAEQCGVSVRAGFVQSDLFAALGSESWDVLVSNPPYLSAEDWRDPQPEILAEPRLALDGGTDGMEFYRKIVAAAPSRLTPGGWIFLEVGAGQAPEVAKMLEAGGFMDIQIEKDLAGIERVTFAKKGI